MGICRDFFRSLINFAVSNPFKPGIWTSSKITAKSYFKMHFKASSPDLANTK